MANKFEPGQVVSTASIADRMAHEFDFRVWVSECLARHLRGDWGDLCAEDAELNNLALNINDPSRLLSAYIYGSEKIWIITEWTRESTTILLPEEY